MQCLWHVSGDHCNNTYESNLYHFYLGNLQSILQTFILFSPGLGHIYRKWTLIIIMAITNIYWDITTCHTSIHTYIYTHMILSNPHMPRGWVLLTSQIENVKTRNNNTTMTRKLKLRRPSSLSKVTPSVVVQFSSSCSTFVILQILDEPNNSYT